MEFHLLDSIYHARCKGVYPQFQTSRDTKSTQRLASRFAQRTGTTPTVSFLVSPTTSRTRTPCSAEQKGFDRNRRSSWYYGFDNSSADSTITAPPKRPRRAGDVQNFHSPPVSVVETVQTIATQLSEEANISPVIGKVSPPDPRIRLLIDQQTPTLNKDLKSLTVNQETYH